MLATYFSSYTSGSTSGAFCDNELVHRPDKNLERIDFEPNLHSMYRRIYTRLDDGKSSRHDKTLLTDVSQKKRTRTMLWMCRENADRVCRTTGDENYPGFSQVWFDPPLQNCLLKLDSGLKKS